MGRAVSRRPLTMEARVPSHGSPCAVYQTQTVIWTGFSPSTSIFPSVSYPATLRTHLHLHATLYQQDKRAKPGNLPKSTALSEIGSAG